MAVTRAATVAGEVAELEVAELEVVARRCAYCMGPNRTRGRCCCPEHARRVSAALAAHRATCRRTLDAIAGERYRLRVLAGRWRAVAMGRDRDAELEAIFGVAPPDA